MSQKYFGRFITIWKWIKKATSESLKEKLWKILIDIFDENESDDVKFIIEHMNEISDPIALKSIC